MAKNTICVWYDKDAEAAARFYAETFPDSAVGAILRAPGDYPSGKKGDANERHGFLLDCGAPGQRQGAVSEKSHAVKGRNPR